MARRRSPLEPTGLYDESAIHREAGRRRIARYTQTDYGRAPKLGAATLMLGYAQVPEPAIEAGVRELASAPQAAKRVPTVRPEKRDQPEPRRRMVPP